MQSRVAVRPGPILELEPQASKFGDGRARPQRKCGKDWTAKDLSAYNIRWTKFSEYMASGMSWSCSTVLVPSSVCIAVCIERGQERMIET